MEFDQAYQGQLDHSFPSPGATPTSADFPGNYAHQTPKTSTFPTYFQDAYSTPQMPGYGTPQQPQSASMTPNQQQSSAETLRSNFYANVQAQSSQHSMLPPTQLSPQHGGGHWDLQPGMVHPGSSMDMSSQMQTPPPTRGSSSKKVAAPSDQIAFGTPSTITSRRFTTPQHTAAASSHAAIPFHTPVHFPQLQFSPDVYQMSQGPATAPVLTQTRLLWEQQSSPTNFTQHSTMDDPFSTPAQQDLSWLTTSMDQSSVQAFSCDTPAMNSFPVQAPHPRPASAVQLSSVPNLQPAAMSQPVSSGVDPSLLYSSPVAQAPVRSNSRATKAKPATKESRKDSAASNQSRASSSSKSDSSSGRASTGLRRSNTTDTVKSTHSQAAITAAEALGRNGDFAQVPRTASPLKRVGRTPLGSISEASKSRQRPSVTLVVDENGRARTETTKAEESPTTKSMRERYPGLWDSDSSEDESDSEERSLTRVPSFSFAKGEERRQKSARLDPPVENLEGLSIPRSSSSASMRTTPSKAAMSAAAQLRRQSSARKAAPAQRSSVRKNPATKSASSLIDTAPMDTSAERPSAAGAELRAQRSQPDVNASFTQSFGSNSHELSAIEAHNRRWGSMSAEQNQQYVQPAPAAAYSQSYAMPQQPFALPPQISSLQIRCVCGVADTQTQPLVQCRSCTQWLHALCLGLDAHRPPPNFTCFLCTRPPPRRRA